MACPRSTWGGGVVELFSPTGTVLDVDGSLNLEGTGDTSSSEAGVADGQTFVIDDGVRTVTFEFDRNGKTTTGNVPVPYGANDDADAIATAISTAIAAQGFNLDVSVDGSQVIIGGNDNDGVVFNTLLTPNSTAEIEVTASGDGILNAWFGLESGW